MFALYPKMALSSLKQFISELKLYRRFVLTITWLTQWYLLLNIKIAFIIWIYILKKSVEKKHLPHLQSTYEFH